MDRRATAARLGAEDPSSLPDLTVPFQRWDPVLGALDEATQVMREYQPNDDDRL
jgi:hypothetical protein